MAQTWIPPRGECLCFLSFLLPCDECPFLWFINLFLQIEWPHLKVEISSNMFDDWITDIGLRSVPLQESWEVDSEGLLYGELKIGQQWIRHLYICLEDSSTITCILINLDCSQGRTVLSLSSNSKFHLLDAMLSHPIPPKSQPCNKLLLPIETVCLYEESIVVHQPNEILILPIHQVTQTL